jgi:serine/threonine-protein kinase
MPDDISVSLDELLERVVPGQVVAGYRLAEQIGAGRMAVVFRAADDKLGRQVALKLLAPALASDAEFRERFSREAKASTAAEHPHIIPVYGAGEDDGILYIAMRLVSGGDLRKLIERTGSLRPDRVAEIISAIASALDAAHEAGLVHRDVNPSNILIDQPSGLPGHVYLSDFGLSKVISSASDISRANELRGTPECMAPEQIQGLAARGRADQYALACVAVHLLTGSPPYEGGITQVLAAHLTAPPPSVHARRQGH